LAPNGCLCHYAQCMPKLSPVSYKQLVRVFEADGFGCVVIKNNPRTANMSRDSYFELLAK
jgi:hypothetical protein